MITKQHIREKMMTDDRWLLIGLITIYKHQTASEQSTRTTNESNGIGFNGPDGNTLTMIAQFLLSRTSEMTIRRDPNCTLEKYLDKQWARDAVRKRMPKYAGQLANIANSKSGQND